jgi:hypothetical protein
MNIGDCAVWNDGNYKTGTIVDYNPLRKVWIVEVDDIFIRNFECEQYEEVAENKVLEG